MMLDQLATVVTHCISLRSISTNKLRNKYVIIASKRGFDVIITYLLRAVFAAGVCGVPIMCMYHDSLRHRAFYIYQILMKLIVWPNMYWG